MASGFTIENVLPSKPTISVRPSLVLRFFDREVTMSENLRREVMT